MNLIRFICGEDGENYEVMAEASKVSAVSKDQFGRWRVWMLGDPSPYTIIEMIKDLKGFIQLHDDDGDGILINPKHFSSATGKGAEKGSLVYLESLDDEPFTVRESLDELQTLLLERKEHVI